MLKKKQSTKIYTPYLAHLKYSCFSIMLVFCHSEITNKHTAEIGRHLRAAFLFVSFLRGFLNKLLLMPRLFRKESRLAGFVVLAKVLDEFIKRIAATGGKTSGNYSVRRTILAGRTAGCWIQHVGKALAEDRATAREITVVEGKRAATTPHFPYNWGKSKKTWVRENE
jgi:hypothetical protein